MKYSCLKCGEIIKGIYQASPTRGSYYSAKCKCGNKGSSDYWNNIKGFKRLTDGLRNILREANK